jgi:16S rRNA (cytosine967-C5)-methyltransferase
MARLVKLCVDEVQGPWTAAAGLLARWLGSRERVDRLLERLPADFSGVAKARCRNLVFGVIRHAGRLEAATGRLVAHAPRAVTRAVLLLAGFELLEAAGEGAAARIVHHAVEQARRLASPAEARLVNAVLRRLAAELASATPPGPDAPVEALAGHFSHPAWLVERWIGQHGREATLALLAWNQRPAPVLARSRGGSVEHSTEAPWLKPTPWPGYFEIPYGRWGDVEPLLEKGSLYVQDPSARHAVALLDPRPGEAVLDVCAAPGGKSLLIADAMGTGALVAMDLPGDRLGPLRENLSRVRGVDARLVEADIRLGAEARLEAQGLPRLFPAVLVDAPCSNTGVMRHRVDVKWRLLPGDFSRHAGQQLALLEAAAGRVAPGGRLVYSTCSLDREENREVVDAFLARVPGRFAIEGERLCFPWIDGHDGAAAFLLRLRGPGRPS